MRRLPPPLTIGERVKYSTVFCRSIGAYSGGIPHARGEIVGLIHYGSLTIAEIRWDSARADVSPRVNVKNLVRANDPELSSL